MKLIKNLKLLLLLGGFFSCDGNNTCGSSAKVIYNLGYPNCTFLIDINGSLFEPTNISQWDTFLFYVDTQDVYIDYQFKNEFSTCSGLEKIDVFCLTNI